MQLLSMTECCDDLQNGCGVLNLGSRASSEPPRHLQASLSARACENNKLQPAPKVEPKSEHVRMILLQT
jgi:hypothetical protein